MRTSGLNLDFVSGFEIVGYWRCQYDVLSLGISLEIQVFIRVNLLLQTFPKGARRS